MDDLHHFLASRLSALEDDGLHRRLVPVTPAGNGFIEVAGRRCLNLSGNDYLGIGGNRTLLEEFYHQLEPETLLSGFGLTAAASRLMTGNHALYEQLETRLARLYRSDRALVFNSGYHGNAGILPSLAGRGDLILADRLCHASLIDGMALTRARTIRYRHLDYTHLAEILEKHHSRHDKIFIVTESVFSMDGDCADLRTLIALKNKYRATLYLDEAHAVGVLGDQGLGLAEQEGVTGDIDLLFGTCGKGLAGLGGFLLCSGPVADFLINRARPLIFSTALPPVCLHWLLFVLERMPEMRRERDRLRVLATKLRCSLAEKGLASNSTTQIVPIVIGDADQTVRVADTLRHQGYWLTPVRPPTVPAGTSRLRLSLSAVMEWSDLAGLPGLISRAIGKRDAE